MTRLLKDSLGSVQAELARSMASCKLESEKVSDAIARLEILTDLVKTSSSTTSDMDCSLKAQPGNKNDIFGTVDKPTGSTCTDSNIGNNHNYSSFEKSNVECESLDGPEEKSPTQFVSCKIKMREYKSDQVIGSNESVNGTLSL